jgi:STE24 endopeptidase
MASMENEPIQLDPERQRSARQYASIQRRLTLLETSGGFLYLVIWMATGLSLRLRERLSLALPGSGSFPGRSSSDWLALALLVLVQAVVIAAPWWLATVPLDFYGSFHLPHRFQISTQTLRGWISDQLKGLGLSILFGVPLLLALNLFLRAFPVWWWLWGGIGYILLSLGLTLLAPIVLLPIFYRIRPLGEEWKELSEQLVRLANSAGARVRGVYVFDMSRRTQAANAALTGLAGTRRILLSDTLIARFSPDEIETILAHELGHQVHRDIPFQILTQSVFILGSLFAGNLALRWSVQAFGYQAIWDPAALPALAISMALIGLLLLPALNSFSRWREGLADSYALEATGKAAAFESAMSRLANQNLAEADPAPWVVALFHGHPPLAARIEKARRFAEQDGCREGLSAQARAGLLLFNQKLFFEAHEELELAWRSEPRRARNLYHGILQLGLAWYQVSRRNYRGAVNMLDRAEFWLASLPPTCQGIDVERIRTQVRRLKSEVEAQGPSQIGRVNPELFSPIPLEDNASLQAVPSPAGPRPQGCNPEDGSGGRGV